MTTVEPCRIASSSLGCHAQSLTRLADPLQYSDRLIRGSREDLLERERPFLLLEDEHVGERAAYIHAEPIRH